MTDAEVVQHRKATRFGRRAGILLLVMSNVAMLISLGILFHNQDEYQRCVAGFQASDSRARQVRTDASSDQSKALRVVIGDAVMIVDPRTPPTAKTFETFQTDLGTYIAAADSYDKKVAKYPYKNFAKECPL